MKHREAAHARRPRQGGATPTSTHPALDRATVAGLRARLLGWFAEHQRDLPWRRTRDPYAIWVSEVMLQQTRVETVVPYYHRFLARFPDVHHLADASADDVLAAWSGLGYYRRARLLHRGAAHVARELGGDLPATVQGLLAVPGIGRYTAGAIASIAFDVAAPLVDGNVARVLARLFAIGDDPKSAAGAAHTWAIAEALVSPRAPGAFNQALMELGATVCVPRGPRCGGCPVAALCRARAEGLEHELPRVSPKRPPRRVDLVAIVARDASGRVLLGQRDESGTFASMWEPPMAERGAPLPVATKGARRVGEVTHVLSHRRLHIEVHAAEGATAPRRAVGGYRRFRWVAMGDLGEVGLATVSRKVLAAAGCD